MTLIGSGTEFMTRPATPLEYATMRGLGTSEPPGGVTVRRPKELEFIVMKGDYYQAPPSEAGDKSWLAALVQRTYGRTSSCVHRSPPAPPGGTERRVILSLDLAVPSGHAGNDDREWCLTDVKKEWRSGMNQRKGDLIQ